MEIRYKAIEHERTEDAPFIGALISAIDCNFKCKGCFNRHLKKMPVLVKDSKDIIAEIKSNPFNQGVIFGGLEWSEQPFELLELMREASNAGLEIMVYTGCNNLMEFEALIGKACADKVMGKDVLKLENNGFAFALIGSIIIENYVKNPYYIKCGRYEQAQKTNNNVQFGVKLSSSNQNIYKIVGIDESMEGVLK